MQNNLLLKCECIYTVLSDFRTNYYSNPLFCESLMMSRKKINMDSSDWFNIFFCQECQVDRSWQQISPVHVKPYHSVSQRPHWSSKQVHGYIDHGKLSPPVPMCGRHLVSNWTENPWFLTHSVLHRLQGSLIFLALEIENNNQIKAQL